MTKPPCCMLWSTLYGCKSHGFPPPEQTTKTRYVIQHRMQMVNTRTDEKYWTKWHDGIGFTKGREGGEYEFTFTDLAEAKRHLASARRRKHAFVMEYKLVEQVSVWRTIA